jgi:antirestriction protein ArdC
MNKAPKRDIHRDVTDKILAAIEADPGEFKMPWRRRDRGLTLPRNFITKSTYSGINIFGLSAAAILRGFEHNLWGSYKQWEAAGAQVRRGAKAETVVFYKNFETEPDPNEPEDDGQRRVARANHVFNIAEVEGVVLPPVAEPGPLIERLAKVDRYVANTKVPVKIGGDRAIYRHSIDTVHMPEEGLFTGSDTMSRQESYYATLLHEICHASGHKSRLNRPVPKSFGDPVYIEEELLVELAAAILCAELQVTQDTRPDHAQYIHHWHQLLKSDSKAIFRAAARASEAVNFLNRLQPENQHQEAA